MRILLLSFFIINNVICSGQNSENKITKLEIYGKILCVGWSNTLPLVGMSDIKKKSTIYVEVRDQTRIKASKIHECIKDLKKGKEQFEFSNYVALLIVHYSNRKKEKYYIPTVPDAGIYKGTVRYELSCLFVSTIYSFLPVYYYEYGPPFYYRKPCEEVE